jgi:predicted dehydrogenase
LIRIGVLGYGYWGPNVARNIAASSLCRLAAICDTSSSRMAVANRQHPGVTTTGHYRDLISDPAVDAIVVATPVQSHFELALAALRAGKHVLIEKPFTSTSEQALTLIEESERRGLILMVDHTYVFAPAIGAIAQAVRNKELGDLWYWDSTRLNLGLIRDDANVVWDLASHDFGILDHVLPFSACAVQATGMALGDGDREHLAYVTLHFPGGFIAHIHASWISPVKVRRTLIGGSRRMLLYDDDLANKVTIDDCGFARDDEDGKMRYRRGGVQTIQLDAEEPLFRAVQHFAKCVAESRRPITDGESGLRVVRLLEAADCSLESGGRVVSLDAAGVLV